MRHRAPGPGWAIASAALVALFAKTFVIDAAVVDGRSMLPLFGQGSVVLVLRCAYGLRLPSGDRYFLRWASPRRGEVVVTRNPRSGATVVKRVAAAGPIELPIAAARLLGPGIDAALAPEAAERFGEAVRLGRGEIFLLGDNLPESVDSRDYGPVPIEAVAGRVLLFAGWLKPRAAG